MKNLSGLPSRFSCKNWQVLTIWFQWLPPCNCALHSSEEPKALPHLVRIRWHSNSNHQLNQAKHSQLSTWLHMEHVRTFPTRLTTNNPATIPIRLFELLAGSTGATRFNTVKNDFRRGFYESLPINFLEDRGRLLNEVDRNLLLLPCTYRQQLSNYHHFWQNGE